MASVDPSSTSTTHSARPRRNSVTVTEAKAIRCNCPATKRTAVPKLSKKQSKMKSRSQAWLFRGSKRLRL
eukprot:2826051-Rhodomonas_salina.1